jgi:MFS family permease
MKPISNERTKATFLTDLKKAAFAKSHIHGGAVESSFLMQKKEKFNLSQPDLREANGLDAHHTMDGAPVVAVEADRKSASFVPLILVSELIMWSLYGSIVTFYPPYRTQHHPSITDTMLGVVIAFFQVGMLVTGPFIGQFMGRVGRKNFIFIGNMAMISASVGFGLLVYIEDNTTFYILSLALRFIQGFGESAANTALNAIIGSEFPQQRSLYFSYLESAIAAGLMVGPVVGQAMFSFLGFAYTFYAIALI